MIDREIYKICFIQFLRDNNIYDIFITYCNSLKGNNFQKYCFDFNDLMLNFDACIYILNAFNWANTIEGWVFWNKYDDDWNNNKENYLKKYKRNEKINELIK